MRKDFIKQLTEAAISTTDLALNVESMSEAIQGMIEKITNIKTKDLAVLVKKIKYDNDIQKADEFQQNGIETPDDFASFKYSASNGIT